MRLSSWSLVLVVILMAGIVHAQDFRGDWQAKVRIGDRDETIRVRIAKLPEAGLTGRITLLERDPGSSDNLDKVAANGNKLTLQYDVFQWRFEGQLNAKADEVIGASTANNKPEPVTLVRVTPKTAWKDSSPHKVQFVTVDKGIKLEVLDWGSGRNLVLLTGLGDSPHVFDRFALKLTPRYHVYAISRRGFGQSTTPPPPAFMVTHVEGNNYEMRRIDGVSNPYASDRLGDDVIAVLDALKIARPVVVGHSIAGEELTSIGTRHPDRVAGFIYLDALNDYAYFDGSNSNRLPPGTYPYPVTLHEGQHLPLNNPTVAVLMGEREYRDFPRNVLAINAYPHELPASMAGNEDARKVLEAHDVRLASRLEQIQKAYPSVHIVQIANADHYIWLSNEADVLRAMDAWIDSLPK